MDLNNIDISKLPSDVRKNCLKLQVMYAEKKIQNKAKDDFLSFVKCVWPEFIEGAHHRHVAKKFEMRPGAWYLYATWSCIANDSQLHCE